MMLLTTRKQATMLLATVGVMGVLAASFFAPMRAAHEESAELKPAPAPAAKKTLATKITNRENDFGDVESVLHIVKRVCKVEFQPLKGRAGFQVVIEMYKDGKLRKTYGDGSTYSVVDPIGANVALFAVDSDYLTLANSPKKHCRMQIDLELPTSNGMGIRSNIGTDIPKAVFDFTHWVGGGWFPREAGSAMEVPLFWLVPNPKEVIAMPTVSGVIEKNSKGDLLIVSLRFRKE